ncbi:hypothetical protein [Algibacter marinivivus]|nr:hypothetical protein [Algibacter marinivivus]
METLVATVLIVIVFILASMILNNLFSNSINNNTQAIETHLNELQYLKQHSQLELPYTANFQNWSIIIETYQENNQSITAFEATNRKTNKTVNFIQNANQ